MCFSGMSLASMKWLKAREIPSPFQITCAHNQHLLIDNTVTFWTVRWNGRCPNGLNAAKRVGVARKLEKLNANRWWLKTIRWNGRRVCVDHQNHRIGNRAIQRFVCWIQTNPILMFRTVPTFNMIRKRISCIWPSVGLLRFLRVSGLFFSSSSFVHETRLQHVTCLWSSDFFQPYSFKFYLALRV